MSGRLALEVPRIVAEVLGRRPEEVRLDSRLAEDLGVDSLAAEDILGAVESRLGVSIPVEASSDMETVADIVAAIENRRNVGA